jgi:SAM-dependent methyltransferase
MHPDILRLHQRIEERHWWFVARRKIMTDVLAAVLPGDGAPVVLDLGCGTGGNIGGLAATHERYECWGLEYDPDATAYAAETYPACRFVCGSALDRSTWPDLGRIDACLLMDVIEHLEDDRTAVTNAAEALSPGGHLMITVPADPRLWSKHDRHHGHFRRYTIDSLAAVLEGLPLERRVLTGFNARLYYPIRVWRGVQKNLPWLADRGTTGDMSVPPLLVNGWLTRLFAGESARILGSIDGPPAFESGVSLLAVYRRASR